MAGMQKIKQKRDSLARFLLYVLGHRPDEFGLVPDEDGFVPFKELVQALSEEDGWKNVREAAIRDLKVGPDADDFEITDKAVRAAPAVTQLAPPLYEWTQAPRLLYHAARNKGYPVILEKGLMPTGQRPFVILADTPDMALRVGRRRDPEAVLLTIHAEKAESRGKLFQRFQEHLYLVDSLSPDLFTGPPLPKEKPEKEKKKEPAQTKPSATPGSFAVRPEFIPGLTPSGEKDKLAKKKRSDVPDWKKAQRKERRRQNQDDD